MAVPGFPAGNFPAANAYNADCPPVLLNLSNYACRNFADYVDELALLGRNGFYRSNFQNRFRFIEQDISRTPDGKLYQANIVWMNRFIEADLEDCATVDLCAPDSTEPFVSTTLTFNPFCTVVKETMTVNEFRRTCADPNSHKMNNILSKLQVAVRSHEKKVFEQLVLGKGGFAQGTEEIKPAVTNINPSPAGGGDQYKFDSSVVGASGALNLGILHELNKIVTINEATNCTPVLISDYIHPLVSEVDTLQAIGCCSEIGVDQQALADQFMGLARFKSRNIGEAMQGLGLNRTEDFYLIHPGASQYLEYFLFDDEDARYQHGESFGTLFQNPIDGEFWDMRVHFNDCPPGNSEPVYVISFVKQGMVFNMPTNLYKTGDYLEGVNGIWELSLTAA